MPPPLAGQWISIIPGNPGLAEIPDPAKTIFEKNGKITFGSKFRYISFQGDAV